MNSTIKLFRMYLRVTWSIILLLLIVVPAVMAMEKDSTKAVLDKGSVQIPRTAQDYYKRGIDYANKGEYSLAIADYNKGITLNPQNVQIYLSRGDIYRTTGQYDLAIADFSQVIKRKPDNVDAYVQRGAAYADKGLTKLSKRDYSKAEALNPQLAETIISEMVLRSIAQSHVDGNVPDKANFDTFLLRDIKGYFKTSEDAVVKYEFLRSGPTQAGIGWPKYYLWVDITDAHIHYEGAMSIAAKNKKLFAVQKFISREEIEKDIHLIDKQFPQSVCGNIMKKVTK